MGRSTTIGKRSSREAERRRWWRARSALLHRSVWPCPRGDGAADASRAARGQLSSPRRAPGSGSRCSGVANAPRDHGVDSEPDHADENHDSGWCSQRAPDSSKSERRAYNHYETSGIHTLTLPGCGGFRPDASGPQVWPTRSRRRPNPPGTAASGQRAEASPHCWSHARTAVSPGLEMRTGAPASALADPEAAVRPRRPDGRRTRSVLRFREGSNWVRCRSEDRPGRVVDRGREGVEGCRPLLRAVGCRGRCRRPAGCG